MILSDEELDLYGCSFVSGITHVKSFGLVEGYVAPTLSTRGVVLLLSRLLAQAAPQVAFSCSHKSLKRGAMHHSHEA